MGKTTARDPFQWMDELFSQFGNPTGRRRADAHEAVTRADWVPLVDISETEVEYLIKLDLTEVQKKDVKISVNAGVLSISGSRSTPEQSASKFHCVERGYGTFARRFSLPEDVEEQNVQAEHRDGLLMVHLPKHVEAKPKVVDIKVH